MVDLEKLHPFGCMVWYKVPEANQKKLDPKGRAALFLSYLSDGNGYRLWDLGNWVVIKSCDVLFDNGTFPYLSPVEQPTAPPSVVVEVPWPFSPSNQPLSNKQNRRTADGFTIIPSDRRLTASIHNPDSPPPLLVPVTPPRQPTTPVTPAPQSSPVSPMAPPPDVDMPNPVPPRRSTCTTRRPQRLGRWAKLAADIPPDVDTPTNWKQVLRSPNKHLWMKAADDEFSSLMGMETWRLVPRPEKRRVIISKWVFKVKTNAQNVASKLKARLVAMGNSQEKGIDYDEVFAPTTRLETL